MRAISTAFSCGCTKYSDGGVERCATHPAPTRPGGSVLHVVTDSPPDDERLDLVPTTISDATAFIEQHHRHHRPPVGGLFAVGVARDGKVVGVAIVGRPVARGLQNGWTAEVTRLATDGTRNACSKLYGAAWRAARALGYRKLVTYTLPEESGASLRGAGWKCIGEAGGGSWSCQSRPRVDRHPLQVKLRWEVT